MAAEFNIRVLFSLVDKLSIPMKNMHGKLKGVQDKLGSAGKKLTAAVTLPLVGLGTVAVKSSFDFSKGMANVATLLTSLGDEAPKRINKLSNSIQNLGILTGTPLKDLTSGLYQTISAFGDSKETMDRLTIANKAAKAGVSSTTEAINLLSAVTKGYDDVSKEATQSAADMAFKTVELGQTTFPELAASIGRVIPLASQLGVKQDELFAGFAALTGVTGNTAEVSTQLASILRADVKPTEFLSKVVVALGKNMGKAFETPAQMIKELGFTKTLNLLMNVVRGNETAAAALFGRTEALSASFALTGSLADTYAEKLDKIRNSSGAMNAAFDAQTKGVAKVAHKFDVMKVKMEVFSKKLGDRLMPLIDKLIDFIERLLEAWDNLSPETKNMVIKIAMLAAAIGPLLIALAGVIGFLNLIIANPIGLIIMGIIAAIVALTLIIKNWGKIVKWFQGIWDRTWKFLKSSWGKLKKVWDKQPGWVKTLGKIFLALNPVIGLPVLIIDNWGKITAFFEQLWKDLEKPINDFIQFVENAWNDPIGTIEEMWNGVLQFFEDLFSDIGKVFDDMWKGLVDKLQNNPWTNWLFGSKKDISLGEGKTEIDINVKAEPGTSATISKVIGRGRKVRARTGETLGFNTGSALAP